MDVIEKYPDLFNTPVEIATNGTRKSRWQGLKQRSRRIPTSTSSSHRRISFSRRFARCWNHTVNGIPTGQIGHVILGGLDGDATACQLIHEDYVDSTGVQDLYYEAQLTLDGIRRDRQWRHQPNAVLQDPGFALTAGISTCMKWICGAVCCCLRVSSISKTTLHV